MKDTTSVELLQSLVHVRREQLHRLVGEGIDLVTRAGFRGEDLEELRKLIATGQVRAESGNPAIQPLLRVIVRLGLATLDYTEAEARLDRLIQQPIASLVAPFFPEAGKDEA